MTCDRTEAGIQFRDVITEDGIQILEITEDGIRDVITEDGIQILEAQ